MRHPRAAWLCLVLAVPASPIACSSPQEREHRRAVAEVQALGGEIGVDETKPGKPVTKVLLGNRPATDATVEHLRAFPELEELYLLRTRVTDECLAYVGEFRNLRVLSLAGTQISDAGLRQLGRLERLETLDLDFTDVSDAGLALLRRSPNLRTLYAHRTRVTDAGASELQSALPDVRVQR